MKMSDAEKLIVMMLTDLHEHLQVKSDLDPSLIRNAIHEGQPWAIPATYPGIFHEDASYDVAKEVSRILSMWRIIEESAQGLSPEERQELAATAQVFGDDPRFPGFDGNAGDGYLGAADFLINKMEGGYDEFRGRNLNSHGGGSTEMHRRMLHHWSNTGAWKAHGGRLGVADLADILNAAVHPGR